LNNWKSRLFGVYRFHFLTHSHSRQRSFIVTRREMKRKRGRVLGYRTIYSSQNALRLRKTSRVLNQSSSRVSHLAGLDCQHYHRDIHIADLRFQNDSLTGCDADPRRLYRITELRQREVRIKPRQRETSRSDTCYRDYPNYIIQMRSPCVKRDRAGITLKRSRKKKTRQK